MEAYTGGEFLYELSFEVLGSPAACKYNIPFLNYNIIPLDFLPHSICTSPVDIQTCTYTHLFIIIIIIIVLYFSFFFFFFGGGGGFIIVTSRRFDIDPQRRGIN